MLFWALMIEWLKTEHKSVGNLLPTGSSNACLLSHDEEKIIICYYKSAIEFLYFNESTVFFFIVCIERARFHQIIITGPGPQGHVLIFLRDYSMFLLYYCAEIVHQTSGIKINI